MNTLIENSCKKFYGHLIQEMEDWQGLETLWLVDGIKWFDTLKQAKFYVMCKVFGPMSTAC